jgi:hypothetical protein
MSQAREGVGADPQFKTEHDGPAALEPPSEMQEPEHQIVTSDKYDEDDDLSAISEWEII